MAAKRTSTKRVNLPWVCLCKLAETLGAPFMRAETYPLQDILKLERRYVIPTFQRDYEWTEDEQWRPLFEDLAATADRYLKATNNLESPGEAKEVSPHFMGAIVCANSPFTSTGAITERLVIDGQQRLTTIQLLIRGLADVSSNVDQRIATNLLKMVFNDDDAFDDLGLTHASTEDRHKLWPRRRDREKWPLVMADQAPEEELGHLYFQARRFFARQAEEYAIVDGELDRIRVLALSQALKMHFKLVVIDLDDNDDAQVIFEVLNARQTPLAAIDLVKNLLFLRGEFDHSDVERLYNQHWAHFDEQWWKNEFGRGHARRERRDILLSIWLTAVTGEEANVRHLYLQAREFVAKSPSIEQVIKEIHAFADAYRTIYDPNAPIDPAVKIAYKRIQSVGINTALPLLTWLRTLSQELLDARDHRRAVQAVESWALRRAFTNRDTRGYGAHFARVLREARRAGATGHNIADAVIHGLTQGAQDWPTDLQMEEAFVTEQFYRQGAQTRLKELLSAVDQMMRSEDPNEPQASIDYRHLEIEHIMPSKWESHWPILGPNGDPLTPDDDDPVWNYERGKRMSYVNRLGNLTLVTSTFNKGVSNRGWESKKPEFGKQKSLAINYDVAAAETWNEAHIETRAKKLAATAARVWPSPEALRSSSPT